MSHAVFTDAKVLRKFRIYESVDFGADDKRDPIPGTYVFVSVRLTWIFDADHDDGDQENILVVHNELVDTERMIEEVLESNWPSETFDKESHLVFGYMDSKTQKREFLKMVPKFNDRWTKFSFTDPTLKLDFAWGIGSMDMLQKYWHPDHTHIPSLQELAPKPVPNLGTDGCVLCLKNPKTVIFEPCGHFYTCSSCALKTKKCHRCNTKIKVRRVESEIPQCRCGERENLYFCPCAVLISCKECQCCNRRKKILM